MTVQEAILLFIHTLQNQYDEREAKQIAFLVLEHHLGKNKLQILTQTTPLNQEIVKKTGIILEELKSGKPIQYLLGETWFCNLKLMVNQHVLIPRPETEELVEWISKDWQQKNFSITPAVPLPDSHSESITQLLDIGTGSGCIALALRNKLQNIEVSAMDISHEALDVARENSKNLKLPIHFLHQNITDCTNWLSHPAYEVIVSNPPYITEEEKDSIEAKVVEHEPHTALFVKNKNPLYFYEIIADFALIKLTHSGCLYFEINPVFATKLLSLLQQKGFSDIKLKEDLHGKKRMVKAIR